MIFLIVDSGFGGKWTKLSMIVLIIESRFSGKKPKLSMIVLIVDSAEVNFHLKLSVLPPPYVEKLRKSWNCVFCKFQPTPEMGTTP